MFGACRKRLATCVVHYGGAGQRLTRPRRDSPKTAEDTICNIYIRPDNRVELSQSAEDLICNIYIRTE